MFNVNDKSQKLPKPKMTKEIIVTGADGTGKTTVVKALRDLGYVAHDRFKKLDDLTLSIEYDNYPENFDDYVVFVLTTDVSIINKRIKNRKSEYDMWDTPKSVFYYNRRYLELASLYGFHVVNVNTSVEKVVGEIERLYDAPCPTRLFDITPELIPDGCELIVEGESKKVYSIKDDPDHCYIVLKNTIYSHSKQSTGEISGLGEIRGAGTRYFLEIMNRNELNHAYVAVNNNGVIYSRMMKNINPLEIVVKEYCEGTDKHSYYGFKDHYTDSDGRYVNGPYVRFDWRNPNHLDDNGVDVRESIPEYYKLEQELGKEEFFKKYLKRPMGDKTISEHLVAPLINVQKTQTEALKMFHAIRQTFSESGLVIKDICFMISEESDKRYFWSEINQDCMRISYKAESLDKDVWRVGGSSSSDLIVAKWNRFNEIMRNHFSKNAFHHVALHKPWYKDYVDSMQNMVENKLLAHRDIYLSTILPKGRRFILYEHDMDVVDKRFPDIMVDYNTSDCDLYRQYYPHVCVKEEWEARIAIMNSARRIATKERYSFLNEERIIDLENDWCTDIYEVVRRRWNTEKVYFHAKTFDDVLDGWRAGAIVIVSNQLGMITLPYLFSVSKPTVIVQTEDGVIRKTFKTDITQSFLMGVLKYALKFSFDRVNNNSLIITTSQTKDGWSAFSNQSSVKVNAMKLQRMIPPDSAALVKMLQSGMNIDTNPKDVLAGYFAYLNACGYNIKDVLNDLNSSCHDIVPKSSYLRHTKIIAVTSSKYAEKTYNFMLNELGIRVLPRKSPRSLEIEYEIVDETKVPFKHFTLLGCRPKDMPALMALGKIDGAVAYNTSMENYPGKVYTTKEHTVVDKSLRLCLIKKKGHRIFPKATIVAEHYKIIKDWLPKQAHVVHVIGSSESYLVNSNYDMCDAIVETGATIDENNLEVYQTINIPVTMSFYK